jgi:hypothetical protein
MLNVFGIRNTCHTPFIFIVDFTRLKLVQEKKQDEIKREATQKSADDKKRIDSGLPATKKKSNDDDITAQFDAQDDEDVVF